MKKIGLLKWGIAMAALVALTLNCSKIEEPLYEPRNEPTCGDGILNGMEYRTDCGGPCSPCGSDGMKVNMTVDSTWIPDSVQALTRFMKFDYISVTADPNGGVLIVASDSFPEPFVTNHITFAFTITNLTKGVHEVPVASGVFSSFHPKGLGGTTSLENGIIKITNIDRVNNLISGTFTFNSIKDGTTGAVVRFEEGEFIDIPTIITVP